MHLVADAPPRPFAVIQLLWNRRVAPFRVPATAAGRADEQLARTTEDVYWLAVGAPDDVAHRGGVRRPCQASDGVRRRLVVLVLVIDAGSVFGSPCVEFLGGDHTAVEQQAFKRCQPALVVTRDVLVLFSGRDLRDQMIPKIVPGIHLVIAQDDRHAEDAPLPGSLENELPVF